MNRLANLAATAGNVALAALYYVRYWITRRRVP